MKDTLYEVHVEDPTTGEWRTVARVDVLEEARIEAVHRIRQDAVPRVRVIHVVDYYAKPLAPPA
jgi:hypothetical protein